MSNFNLIADISLTLAAVIILAYYPTVKKNYSKAVKAGKVSQEQAEKNMKLIKYATCILPVIVAYLWASKLFF